VAAFLERLEQAYAANGSLLCVGLDPEPSKLPAALRDLPPAEAVLAFNRAIIEATADLVACYKPNLAFYEALGPAGLEALRQTLALVPPGILTIGDAKRGDIENTMQRYAAALFDVYGFGAVTASPYLGRDALAPFLDRSDRGTFVLCRTSNPGASEIVELEVARRSDRAGKTGAPAGVPQTGAEGGSDGWPLYLIVAERVQAWNTNHNAGLVVGATYPRELARVREVCPELPILLPGIGAQQGDLEASVRAGLDRAGAGLLIVAARQVLYASSGDDFPQAARQAAAALHRRISQARPVAVP
jgi:orotidine-5'-phosphate decarboxylase